MLSNKFMMQKHLKIFFLILFGTFFLANNSLAYGNHQPLEIIAPKEAGTGNPAIPSTHRVFRAYPGIQYEFKAQVIGGTYPYVFSLSNAPEGMTIDRKTGVIIWPNPQQDANDIQITVHDKNGTSISSTWDIDVTTNGFIFVDANAQDGGNGTLNSPYNKINDFSSRNATDIVCFREGTYNLPVRGDYTVGNASGYVWSSPTDAPHKWIAGTQWYSTFGAPDQDGWHWLEFHVKLNSDYTVSDGMVEVWYDGDFLGSLNDVLYRGLEENNNAKMTHMVIMDNQHNGWIGGPHEQWTKIENIVVSTDPIGTAYVVDSGELDMTAPAIPSGLAVS